MNHEGVQRTKLSQISRQDGNANQVKLGGWEAEKGLATGNSFSLGTRQMAESGVWTLEWTETCLLPKDLFRITQYLTGL